MARRPNYDFERRERDRLKAIKAAEKAEAKRLQRERDAGIASEGETESAPPAAED